MDGVEDMLAECKQLLKQTVATKPRYIPGVPQIPGKVGYITQISSADWPKIEVIDPNYQSEYQSAGHTTAASNPDLEALLAKYASVPNVPSARITNQTDIAFENAFLDNSRSGKFISGFDSRTRQVSAGRSNSQKRLRSATGFNQTDKFAKAFSSTASNHMYFDELDKIPKRIILPESLRVRLTGVSTRSTVCFSTAFRVVKIKSDQSSLNIHDQKSHPKQKSSLALQPSFAHSQTPRHSDKDQPDNSRLHEHKFLQMMLNHCTHLGKVTASSGERKSILKTSSKRVGSKSPPKDAANLGMDQSFVSNSEGLCHSLVMQSKFGQRESESRSNSRSKSRSNSNKKIPWRPNSVVAPIPSHPEPISYLPPTVVLKADHPLYESVSALKSSTKPTNTQKKQRGLIRDTNTTASTADKPKTVPTATLRRSRLYDPRPGNRPQPQAADSVFEASSLSLHDPELPKQVVRTSKSVRTVTFGNSISDGAPMKPKSVAPEERLKRKSGLGNSSRDLGNRSSAAISSGATVTPVKQIGPVTHASKHFVKGRTQATSQSREEPRKSNIQRSSRNPATESHAASNQRQRSDSATKLNRDIGNWTLGGTSALSSSKIGLAESDKLSPLDHEHGPGQTGCSICVYNFGRNLPYETKHLAKLYAARRDEYQKQVLANPELALLEMMPRSRSNSKSAERLSRNSSRVGSAAKSKVNYNSVSGRTTAHTQIKCESTGSSSLERARRLKKELNQAVQQQKVSREPVQSHKQEEDDGCLERLGLRGKVSVQEILQRYSTQGASSIVGSENDVDEAPRVSIGLNKVEPVRRSSPALGVHRAAALVSSHAKLEEESGVLVKPNGDRYEFRLKKIN